MPLLAASAYEIVLAVHVVSVVVAFGWVFALPVVFFVAARHDPRSLPLLHRIEYAIERVVVNPALTLVVGAGAFLASDGHRWSEFFVGWGLGAAILIGAIIGSVMIPAAKRAERLATRDVEAASGYEIEMSGEYAAAARRLSIVGSAMGLLVVATIAIMVIKP